MTDLAQRVTDLEADNRRLTADRNRWQIVATDLQALRDPSLPAVGRWVILEMREYLFDPDHFSVARGEQLRATLERFLTETRAVRAVSQEQALAHLRDANEG